MLKTHKFNKRLKTQSKKERENTKSNLPLETSSSTGPLNTLTKINKTEEFQAKNSSAHNKSGTGINLPCLF